MRRIAHQFAGAVAFAGLALAGSPAAAAVAYDETASGDLSNSGTAPTLVSLGIGENLILGTSGRDQAGVIDRDYFTFTLAPDQTLAAINVLTGTTTINLSFIGFQEGNQVTVSPAGPTAAGLLGWTHYDAGDVGSDILDDMGIPMAGSIGFGAVGAGTYAFWVQEASPGTATYRFDFQVAQVPEASTWAMMLAGFGLIGIALRRRRSATPAPALA